MIPLFPNISPTDIQFVMFIKYCDSIYFKFFSATTSWYFCLTWWVPYFFAIHQFFGITLLQTRQAHLSSHFGAAMQN